LPTRALLFGHWARPSFARIVEDARPFRRFFPLGAPEQD
jgi:glutathione S-transferase